MSKGEGRTVSLWVRADQEHIIRTAHAFMDDMGVSFSSLVSSALEEYLQNHKPVPGVLPTVQKENRMATKRHICCNVIRSGTPRERSCKNGARWEFWDAGKNYLDTYYHACSRCLPAMLDPDITQYIRAIEY